MILRANKETLKHNITIWMVILPFSVFKKKKFPGVSAGLDRTALDQALTQLAALAITLAFALIGGWLTGN